MENLQPDNLASFSWVRPTRKSARRTQWAEPKVEEFLSLPFFSEFVFRDLQTVEPRKHEQVADFLIFHRRTGILIERKCQEDPGSRTGRKLDLWTRKKAKEAWSQVRRAFTRRRDFPIFCNHPRQGRVEFPDGLPAIQHCIVAAEVFDPVDLQPAANDLPLDYSGIPITYLSLNDFLNLAVLLRSIPELTDYLSARRSLPAADLRRIGEERVLFSFYLLSDGSFAGCGGISDARSAVAAQDDRLQEALKRKFEADRFAQSIEDVANALATRNPHYAEGVPGHLLAAYDPAEQRHNHLEMQAALADLRLRERSELGRALHSTIERVSGKDPGFIFRSARFDSMPDWVYVVAAAKNVDQAELLSRALVLLAGAMAFYEKPKCLVIIDRGRSGYEVALSRPGVKPAPEISDAGRRLFSNLRITSTPLQFLPRT
jgi:hypothetical protein